MVVILNIKFGKILLIGCGDRSQNVRKVGQKRTFWCHVTLTFDPWPSTSDTFCLDWRSSLIWNFMKFCQLVAEIYRASQYFCPRKIVHCTKSMQQRVLWVGDKNIQICHLLHAELQVNPVIAYRVLWPQTWYSRNMVKHHNQM